MKNTPITFTILTLSFLTLILPQNAVLASKNPFIPRSAQNITVKPKFTIPYKINPFLNPWNTIYTGYGTVNWDSNTQHLTMSPKVATQANETHAALVLSKTAVHQPFQLSYTMKTTKQLRTGTSPNAWEVGWTVFGYKDDGKFKYLILKPNGYGLEIGESLLNDKQNFLYTSAFNQDLFPINSDYNTVINVKNNIITITVNDKQFAKYTMTAKDVLSVNGKYGFYTEDATVQVSNIKMQQL